MNPITIDVQPVRQSSTGAARALSFPSNFDLPKGLGAYKGIGIQGLGAATFQLRVHGAWGYLGVGL